jgi:hypothetical protein
VRISHDTEELGIRYVGVEINPCDQRLTERQKESHWPSDVAMDANGRFHNVREKAAQHAGVCVTYRASDSAHLNISWAVFLPLSERVLIPLPGISVSVEIILHGYFFVDSGRNRPDGLDLRANPSNEKAWLSEEDKPEEDKLRREWNRRLAEIGTLPLVPRSLKAITGAGGLTDAEMLTVTAAIQTSEFFAEFKNQICSANNWGLLWNADCSRSWRLFDANTCICELPESSERLLASQLFPALAELLADINVTGVGSPRLLNDRVAAPWESTDVDSLIESIRPGETLNSSKRVDYLCDFLDLLAEGGELDSAVPSSKVAGGGNRPASVVRNEAVTEARSEGRAERL